MNQYFVPSSADEITADLQVPPLADPALTGTPLTSLAAALSASHRRGKGQHRRGSSEQLHPSRSRHTELRGAVRSSAEPPRPRCAPPRPAPAPGRPMRGRERQSRGKHQTQLSHLEGNRALPMLPLLPPSLPVRPLREGSPTAWTAPASCPLPPEKERAE